MRRRLTFLVALAGLAALAPLPDADAAVPATAWGHLTEVVGRSPAPEYRRFGSPGMVDVAAYERSVLDAAGYATVELNAPAERWWVDYSPGHEPELLDVASGHTFPAESGFDLGATTGPEGVTCTLRRYDQVQPGDCGFVPFHLASPEWKNLLADAPGALATIVARGGVGAVVQGDRARQATIALKLRAPIPSVVAAVDEDEVVGRTVRLRAMGEHRPAVTRDVVGVLRPPAAGHGYVVVLAHADGWFEAAADNGSGTAAALRAAQLLAAQRPAGAGVLVALVDGEEVGYHGTRALLDRLRSPEGLVVPDGCRPLHLADLRGVVNLDAVSARASDVGLPPPFSWRVIVHTEDVTGLLGALRFAAGGVLGVPVPASVAEPINGGFGRTDAGFFAAEGLPVVWPVAGYPEYHTSADTLATVDPADLEAVAVNAAAVARYFGAR